MRVEAVCLGELLIDFVSLQAGVRLAAAPGFAKAAGGAPANVAVGLARLGVSTAFISKVGEDEFGYFLRETLQRNRVGVAAVRSTSRAPTALAFVSLSGRGERDFLFYRDPCADALLEPRDIPVRLLEESSIFHFGSISLIREPSRSATYQALKLAERNGLLISFDPNLRRSLWPSVQRARQGSWEGIKRAHLVKLSLEELKFLTGSSSLPRSLERIWRPRHQLLVVSLGRRGCCYRTRDHRGFVSGFSVHTVDTTGAGDAFVAGMLLGVLQATARGQSLAGLRPAELEQLFRLANACGALTTLARGAIPSLPRRRQVTQFLRTQRVR